MKNNFPAQPRVKSYPNYGEDGFNMLEEDLHNRILPYKRGNEFSEFRCEIISESNADRINAVNICKELSDSDYAGNDTDLISEVVRSLASDMSPNGDFTCEIICDSNSGNLRFIYFPSNGLFKIFNKYFQVSLKNKIFNTLNKDNIWRIEIPKALGGKRGFSRMMSRIDSFDSLAPKFLVQDIENMRYLDNINISSYTVAKHIYIAKSSLLFGWNQRDIDKSSKNDFYRFYQMLSFYYAVTILRESIVKELNNLLTRLEIKSEIKIYGLPSSNDIFLFRQDFINGNKSMSDVNKLIFG